MRSNITNSRVVGCRPAHQADDGGGKEGGNRLSLSDWLQCARRSLHVWKVLLTAKCTSLCACCCRSLPRTTETVREGSTDSTGTDFESACESVMSTPRWQGASSKWCAYCLLLRALRPPWVLQPACVLVYLFF